MRAMAVSRKGRPKNRLETGKEPGAMRVESYTAGQKMGRGVLSTGSKVTARCKKLVPECSVRGIMDSPQRGASSTLPPQETDSTSESSPRQETECP
jgi:hypothetical protein